MKLVIDIGNSRIKAALFSGSEIQSRKVFAPADIPMALGNLLENKTISSCLFSCVSGRQATVVDFLQSKGITARPLDAQMPLPVTLRYMSPQTLGSDRLAAVVGAHTIFPRHSVLVIDAGTAITYDYLNEQGEFLGGNISPGLTSRFRCLHENTGALPLLEPEKDIPAIGYNTPSAIIAGVQQSVIFEINEYIRQFQKNPAQQKVILTGGDAGFLKEFIQIEIKIEPDLVIKGLNRIIEHNE